jgi:hypothetical protein
MLAILLKAAQIIYKVPLVAIILALIRKGLLVHAAFPQILMRKVVKLIVEE